MHDKMTIATGRRARWLAGLAFGALVAASPAHAETLQGALAKAYENNPTLTGARAGQRANDENVPIQKAAGLPSVAVSFGFCDAPVAELGADAVIDHFDALIPALSRL